MWITSHKLLFRTLKGALTFVAHYVGKLRVSYCMKYGILEWYNGASFSIQICIFRDYYFMGLRYLLWLILVNSIISYNWLLSYWKYFSIGRGLLSVMFVTKFNSCDGGTNQIPVKSWLSPDKQAYFKLEQTWRKSHFGSWHFVCNHAFVAGLESKDSLPKQSE